METNRPGICHTLAELQAIAVMAVAQANHWASKPIDPTEMGEELVMAMIVRGDLKKCSKHPDRWIQKNWQKHVKAAGERMKDAPVYETPLDDLL